MPTDCLFCKIAQGAIPVQRLAEDDFALAFPDINPQAPTHVLIIPKVHVASIAEAAPDQEQLIGRMHSLAVKLAKEKGIAESGFRLVMNTGREAGQTVFHLHLHLIGGRQMRWPPG
jgi:histidine triad (HIT) family protein